MTRRSIEHKIQKDICKLLRYALPADATFWAVPNGGSRKGGAIEGKRLKDEGVTAGVADLHILSRGKLICLEVKTPKGLESKEGKQSDSQIEWQKTITQCGGLYAVVRSVDEVKALLDMIIGGKA